MYKNRNNGVKRTGTAHAANRKTPRASTQPNNVYAGKNGSVNRQQGNNWQTRDQSGWSNSKGSSSANQNRDAQARQRSSQRTTQNRSATQNRSRSGGGGKRR
jgi:hypothetical protein